MSKNELFDPAGRICAETRSLIGVKASSLAVKEVATSRLAPPLGADPLSVAKWFIAESQRHVAAQLVLLAQLDRAGHAQLAAKARNVLVLVEGSLRLARQYLARIERESDAGVYGPS